MTANLDKNERAIHPGQRVKVEGTVERVDRFSVFVRVTPGLVVDVPPLAVEVTE